MIYAFPSITSKNKKIHTDLNDAYLPNIAAYVCDFQIK